MVPPKEKWCQNERIMSTEVGKRAGGGRGWEKGREGVAGMTSGEVRGGATGRRR